MSLNIDYLKARLDPHEVLEELGVDIAYNLGAEIMCHCPDFMGNHKNGDAVPSFGFNSEKLTYNCFVCGGGSLFNLVQEMMNYTEKQAEAWLISMANLEPADTDKFKAEIEKILNPIVNVEPDPEYPVEALFPFRKIHPYLLERGISKETLIKFQVGYDDAHYGITIPHFFMGKLKGWQTRHLVAQDIDGRTVYWCPLCEPYHQPNRVPKYKNTSNFPKANTLFGYDQAMEYCREEGRRTVIVVESPMTALYLHAHGYKNVMATFGSFNYEQGSLLFGFDLVYFWPDNDDAGKTNAKRAVDGLSRYVNLMIVPVVDGEKSDAANLRPEALEEYIFKSYPASLFDQLGLSTLEGARI